MTQSEHQALEALRRRLGSQDFLETLPIGIYCCGHDGLIRQFNRRAAELWGRSPQLGESDERFCGAHRLHCMDGTPLPHDQTPMADAVRRGVSTRDGRIVIERPDGSRITVMVNIEPLLDETGRLVGAVNCFQDITDHM
ncbi:PAS domain-containing protein, partial [Geminicoccus flavidas]|uniref:PAS domain-containing protein n=1 Tax=Geminicoccus flavidas TaxID=2506407 RepID=UPI00135C3B16